MSVKKQDALDYHALPTPGKISIAPTKPSATQLDLSLGLNLRTRASAPVRGRLRYGAFLLMDSHASARELRLTSLRHRRRSLVLRRA